MDFTTLLKILLEKAMQDGQPQNKSAWWLMAAVFLAVLLFGSASLIAAIGQLITALGK